MMTNLKHFLSALVGLTPAGIYDVTVYQLGSWLFAGEVVMEASEEKWKFMRVRGREGGSIPLSRVMDTNFFISPSLIIKQPHPPAAQYF